MSTDTLETIKPIVEMTQLVKNVRLNLKPEVNKVRICLDQTQPEATLLRSSTPLPLHRLRLLHIVEELGAHIAANLIPPEYLYGASEGTSDKAVNARKSSRTIRAAFSNYCMTMTNLFATEEVIENWPGKPWLSAGQTSVRAVTALMKEFCILLDNEVYRENNLFNHFFAPLVETILHTYYEAFIAKGFDSNFKPLAFPDTYGNPDSKYPEFLFCTKNRQMRPATVTDAIDTFLQV